MAKIMLVEDDNNLREIYEARLLAEGYEIVSAKDGEEALAMAVKEKPDLIIADVMMPNISGFDMLDILRSTPETRDTKVIMMTALSQAEDKARAEKLGADRYLVKSQVTLEDVAKVAREVLEGKPAAPGAGELGMSASLPPMNAPAAGSAAAPTAGPVTPVPAPSIPAPDLSQPTHAEPTVAPQQVQPTPPPEPTNPSPVPTPPPATAVTDDQPSGTPPVTTIPVSTVAAEPLAAPSLSKKVIQPINDPTKSPDLDELLAKEEKQATADEPVPAPPAQAVITPAGEISTPAPSEEEPLKEEEAAPPVHAPGQVISPSGGNPTAAGGSVDPNSIAL